MDCQHKRNLEDCRCTYLSCSRRGNCCACVRNHRDKGELPACFFSREGEMTYDRSLEHLFRDRGIKNS